ncbi:MAG: GNAT family N-acetyltransferase [Chitinophagaceae bacterium]|nr:GNAT family N-acetyltransferase [Chitinophagaceae bacterium]MCB9044943.1 GNAT family N-acetyltransferase [Chitinophagales bacterium]
MNMHLQKTTVDDLETLFIFQTDETSNYVAAFNTPDPADKQAYMEKWRKIVANSTINMKTIFVDDVPVGSVAHFEIEDETNVSYWIDRQHWGKGIATKALQQLLATTDKKILYARIAYDNTGSQKVLERNGFVRIGTDKGFANGRGKEIEEFVYRLEL